jgi:hypothetical protein
VYALAEHRSVKQLALSRDALSAAVSQEQAQIDSLSQKLLVAQSTPAPAPAAVPEPAVSSAAPEQAPVSQPSVAKSHRRKHVTTAKAQRKDDAWREQVQSQLAEEQKAIAEHQREIQDTQDSVARTRTDLEGNLQSTRDDLNGSIAKNHEELVALERKGERNFYEFNLMKTKQFQKEGPLSISLRKSNDKHDFCDLVLIVNDSEVTKKHVNLYEPVQFYPEGYSQPLQVVINSIGKDSARGYVSEPKEKPSRVVSTASSGGAAPAASGQTPNGSATTDTVTLQPRPEAQQ